MERIKLGVIGLGLAWERLHAPALARLADKFEIAVVCDRDLNKAREVGQFLGLAESGIYKDYMEMLIKSDIEAVLSLVPISENYETASAVIKSRKHLIAEKPFASKPEAARELIKLKDRVGVTVMVAENIRYEEENNLIKRLLTGGQIGNPVYFIDNHITEYQQEAESDGFAQTSWRQHPDYPGGVFLDSGVHHIAALRYLFGDCGSVYAHGRPSPGLDFAPYSCVNALLTFSDNVAGHYSFFVLGKETQRPLVGLRIFGTHGEIYLEERGCGFVNITYKDERPASAIAYTSGEGYYHELEDFHAALRLGGKIESTPEKALGDIETIYAILESAKLGGVRTPGYDTEIKSEHLHRAYVLPSRVASYPGTRST